MAETPQSQPDQEDQQEEVRVLGEQERDAKARGADLSELGTLAAMLDVPMHITVELGRAKLPLAEVLALKPGSVVELDRFPGEPLDLYANGRLIARGEIIVLNDIFGFRITDVVLDHRAAERDAEAST